MNFIIRDSTVFRESTVPLYVNNNNIVFQCMRTRRYFVLSYASLWKLFIHNNNYYIVWCSPHVPILKVHKRHQKLLWYVGRIATYKYYSHTIYILYSTVNLNLSICIRNKIINSNIIKLCMIIYIVYYDAIWFGCR